MWKYKFVSYELPFQKSTPYERGSKKFWHYFILAIFDFIKPAKFPNL